MDKPADKPAADDPFRPCTEEERIANARFRWQMLKLRREWRLREEAARERPCAR